MYSQRNDRGDRRPTQGAIPHATPHTTPRGMPSYRQKVRVPPNYNGLAIVDGEEQLPGTDTPSEALLGGDAPSGVLPENRDFGQGLPPEPHFDSLEQVSDLPRRDIRPVSVGLSAGEAIPVSRPGGLFDLSHFPFGHGLGAEEWLILGLILLLLHEAGGNQQDRGDLDETVILLGLLLLGG